MLFKKGVLMINYYFYVSGDAAAEEHHPRILLGVGRIFPTINNRFV